MPTFEIGDAVVYTDWLKQEREATVVNIGKDPEGRTIYVLEPVERKLDEDMVWGYEDQLRKV